MTSSLLKKAPPLAGIALAFFLTTTGNAQVNRTNPPAQPAAGTVTGIAFDHADWADSVLPGGRVSLAAQPAKFSLTTSRLTIQLSEDGRIVAAAPGQNPRSALGGETLLAGCHPSSSVTARALPEGGYAFTRRWIDSKNHSCIVVDTFRPTPDSIRWDVEITGEGAPWTTEIETKLAYPATSATRFWTAWSDPEHQADRWRDPLVLEPLTTNTWTFGGSTTKGDYTSLPLATLAEPARDSAISLVFSPEDTILTTQLTTTPSGAILFSRSHYRIVAGKPLKFSMDLTAHEADWRGGLRWMTTRYPQFFDPPNSDADAMAGCGAYSGDEDPIDVAKFKKMAFRINWKLSDDFPYMGMFIPPVKNADERWERSGDEKAPPDKPGWTSCRRLNDYARYMKDNGFFVLDYFNVTEFGKNMDVPSSTPAPTAGSPDLWKFPRAFLSTQLPGALLKNGDADRYRAAFVDPGDPVFQQFLLEQADRHIRLIPDSSGICIDRLDWIPQFNEHADDGVSWVQGKPARSLFVSWNSLLARLGPRLHDAHKVIFANPVYSRLDLLRQVDGIYTEFGNTGPSLNACAFMGLRKPVLAWTYNVTLHQPDPDSFFQRQLLLGVYPTAPYPWNNHCITPDPAADRHYLDYGPLLDAMRGKKWVLEPHCVETTTAHLKVNLFQVPGGYVIPVTFGAAAGSATVQVRNIPGLAHAICSALHPGVETAIPLHTTFHDGTLELQVPLKSGCAMVRLAMP